MREDTIKRGRLGTIIFVSLSMGPAMSHLLVLDHIMISSE
jgi:hypothetical protein